MVLEKLTKTTKVDPVINNKNKAMEFLFVKLILFFNNNESKFIPRIKLFLKQSQQPKVQIMRKQAS